MQISTLKATTIGSWIIALVYDWIETTTGMEPRILLYGAVLLLMFGLFTCSRENKETKKGEA